MREIKFRAWNKKNKQWVTKKIGIWGEDIIIYDRDAGDDGILAFRHKTESCYPEKCWDEVEINQYTGLKDKNGKDVYEADLLIHDGDKDCRFEVFYNPDIASFSIFRHHYSGSRCGGFTPAINSSKLEVIGNVWENPELLQEDK